MARINSNIPSLIAQNNLNAANNDLSTRLQRLATGLRINRGADDPAGLIVSERLRSEVKGLERAVSNSERASSVIATAEASLAEVSDLLNSIKSLLVEASSIGGNSEEEREANQKQIDSAIDSITRISNSSSFAGLKLLNGGLDYVLSGLAASSISKASIFGANFGSNDFLSIDVEVVASAQTAQIYLSASNAISGRPPGTLASSTTLEIAGPLGVQVIEVLSGTTMTALANAINLFKDSTGVSASVLNGNDLSGLVISSIAYGSDAFVGVSRLGAGGTATDFQTFKLPQNFQIPTGFMLSDLAGDLQASRRDNGRDVTALINGVLGTGRGLVVSVQDSASLSMSLQLTSDLATRQGESTNFQITSGGARYQLGGQINISQQVNIGLPSVAASRLGGTLVEGVMQFLSSLKTGGGNDIRSRNFEGASAILETAIDEVAVTRGRLGAFERNTLDTNIRSLQAAIENLTASESVIRDADFAKETSALTRAQILSSAATSTLALANSQSQQVLQLLG